MVHVSRNGNGDTSRGGPAHGAPDEAVETVETVWVTDGNGLNYYQSPSWYQYIGEAPGSSYGEDWLRFYHPEDRDLLRREWTKALHAKGAYRYDIRVRIRRSDGVYRWFRVQGLPSTDPAGVARWVGTCVSLDDRLPAGALAHRGRYGVRLAVEKYGSLAHLADALGVERAQMQRWLRGDEEVPEEDYIRMILLVTDNGG